MTQAEKMRKITNEANERRRARVTTKNTKYARKIADTKIRNIANAGGNGYTFAVGRFYVPSLVVTAFEEMGFQVTRNGRNGKALLTIKW